MPCTIFFHGLQFKLNCFSHSSTFELSNVCCMVKGTLMVECATIEYSYIGIKFRMVRTIAEVESCVLEL
jgi:hypothetical protein